MRQQGQALDWIALLFSGTTADDLQRQHRVTVRCNVMSQQQWEQQQQQQQQEQQWEQQQQQWQHSVWKWRPSFLKSEEGLRLLQ